MKAIMVGVDGSPNSEVAVRYAIEIAAAADAGVVGMASIAEDFDGEAELEEHAIEEIEGIEHLPTAATNWFRNALGKCREVCATADIDFVAQMLAGDPGHVITEEAQACDMVVIGARGRRAQHGDLLGTTARRIIRDCIKPVLVTREEYREVKRVLVGYDGSPASGHAVEWAADIGCVAGWEIGIITGAVPASELAQGAQYAARLVSTRGLEAETMIARGDAPSVVFDHVREWNADLVAIGGARKGTLTGFFLGEAWPDIVEQAKVPVMRWR